MALLTGATGPRLDGTEREGAVALLCLSVSSMNQVAGAAEPVGQPRRSQS